MDTMTVERRSSLMSRIRSVSAVERRAKALAEFRAGCRLTHQPKGVHGRPDYASKKMKVALFMHGCFWHQPCPLGCSRAPKSNAAFWERKFARNRARHEEVVGRLVADGWKVITIWEHEVK